MAKFIKIRKTLINSEDIEAVYPARYRNHRGFEKDEVVVRLKNGHKHRFDVDSSFDIEKFVDGIFEQICN